MFIMLDFGAQWIVENKRIKKMAVHVESSNTYYIYVILTSKLIPPL